MNVQAAITFVGQVAWPRLGRAPACLAEECVQISSATLEQAPAMHVELELESIEAWRTPDALSQVPKRQSDFALQSMRSNSHR